jgi:uncharacterized membrane protein YeaQ/YmgE (transglycosylase-associated protein family)
VTLIIRRPDAISTDVRPIAYGVTGFNLWSVMVAVVGAVALLFNWHAVRGPITRA